MTVLCFVDANLIVYAVNQSEPFKQEVATNLIARLWVEQRGRISIQVLNEFHAVVTRKFRHVIAPERAGAMIDQLLLWDPQPINSTVFLRAREIELRHKLNWWDCLIVAAARLQQCTVLYTEDLQHGATIDGVKIVNPFIAQVQEEPAHYAAQVISPHRPRGRPRKQPAAA
jgi:predicted nucleic acid-binding protein